MSNFIIQSQSVLDVASLPKEDTMANFTFYTGQNELLKVATDGFNVKGKKIDVDDDEAKSVYRAFKEFLIWAALTRN